MSLDLKKLKAGHRREISRAFSAADKPGGLSRAELSSLWTGAAKSKAPMIGISGPPGAGKSTFLNELIRRFPKTEKILVLCIDPASPVSGGALLGDRIRFREIHGLPNVFVRSLSNFGSQNEIAQSLDILLLVALNAGFQWILIEGIGAGQSDFRLREFVDTYCVLLVPESGDSIQLLKAGTLELADLIVLNKSDRPGSDLIWNQIQGQLEKVPSLKVVAEEGEGMDQAYRVIISLEGKRAKNHFIKRRSQMMKRLLLSQLAPQIVVEINQHFSKAKLTKNPFRVALNSQKFSKAMKACLRSLR